MAVGSFPAELRREDSELDLKIGLLASENARIGRWSIQSLVIFLKSMIRSCMSLICDFMAYRWLHVMETQEIELACARFLHP